MFTVTRTCCLLLMLCALGLAQKQNENLPLQTTIHGRVLINGRSAPQGVRVSLELGGSQVAETITDNSGQFEIRGMNAGLFDCVVSQPGYRTVHEVADVRTAATAYVMIDLKPLPNANGPNVPPEGPSGMMSVKTANVPAAAQQEFDAGQKTFATGKDLGSAVKSFRKAVELAPNFTEAYVLMGMAQLGQKHYDDAEKSFTKAISLDATFAPAFVGLGESQNSQGKFEDAYTSLSKAASLKSESPEAQYELAKSLWGLKRWEEAEPHAAKSLALKPDYPDAHVLMGNILLRKRDAEGALRQFQEYLRLAPKGAMAEPTRELVSKLEAAIKTAKR
jgi:tetratricopeptide (TPR) repeat protein